jgi:HD superfamily phosphodiesterase
MPELDHSAVWAAARPYMRTRKNDIHIPLSYDYARRLLEAHPDADAEVVLLAILLHDIGWAVVDQEAMLGEAFGANAMEADVRFAHEREGARLAREILGGLDYPEAVIEEVAAIIDGHDTRPHAISRNDELVKDADALWRFSVVGTAIACDWWGETPSAYGDRVTTMLEERLFTDTAREIARAELAETTRLLRFAELADPVQTGQ